jgi:hypothetical protein
MNRQHHGRVIHTSIRMKTTPMKAWEAWADPQKIANWFVDRAEGTATPGSTMKWFFDSFGYAMDVPIAEADPWLEPDIASAARCCATPAPRCCCRGIRATRRSG